MVALMGMASIGLFFGNSAVSYDVQPVVAEGGIAWVVGYRPAQWARITRDTARVYSLSFEPSHGV